MNGIRVWILILLISVGQAQTVQVLRGRLEADYVFMGTDYTVELEDPARPGPRMEASVNHDGSFEFRNLTQAQYTLRLKNRGDTVCERFVDSLHAGGELTIRLPARPVARTGAPTVSVRELLRPVPQKAFRAFAAAQHYVDTGRESDAVRKLEEALRICPDYVDARTNLGAEYIRLGRPNEAVEQFEKAIASGPPSAVVLSNLAYALSALNRLQDAERAARSALEVDKSYGRAHYMLGNILARSVVPGALQKAPEAALHLRLGASDVPHGHLTIAQMYLVEGDRPGAAEEIRLYLKCADNRYRANAERWLAQILLR